jgi:hypothetical protein
MLICGGGRENLNVALLLDAGKKVGLEVNSEKTKYVLMSCKKAGSTA